MYESRNERLAQIPRFQAEYFMRYRTNVGLHTKRVKALCESLRPYLADTIDMALFLALAPIHDDTEIYTGDIPTPVKDNWTPLQRKVHSITEKWAREHLTQQDYPGLKIDGFEYKDLLEIIAAKDTVEAQLLSYIDKVGDGLGESFHEVYGGNQGFVHCVRRYMQDFSQRDEKFPLVGAVFKKLEDHPLLHVPTHIDLEKIAQESASHTALSVQVDTGNPHYDFWKKITVENLGIEVLYRQIEGNMQRRGA